MMIHYDDFKVCDHWASDIAQYKACCDGHVESLQRKIDAKRGNPPITEPTSQIARIHDAELAQLEKQELFWAEQSMAAEAGFVFDPRTMDSLEWSHRHRSLRAEAVRLNLLRDRTWFDAYAAETFAPKDYARQA